MSATLETVDIDIIWRPKKQFPWCLLRLKLNAGVIRLTKCGTLLEGYSYCIEHNMEYFFLDFQARDTELIFQTHSLTYFNSTRLQGCGFD